MAGVSIRHDPNVARQVQQAHKLLGIISDGFDQAGRIMQATARTSMTDQRTKDYFERVLPLTSEDDLVRERVAQRHNRWVELFEVGDGNQMPGARGTLWAAYNGITQWVDRESYTTRNREPLNTIWFGEGERLKRRAFDVASAMAGASLN